MEKPTYTGMFSKKFYKIIYIILSLASHIGAIPFYFDKKQRRFVSSKFFIQIHNKNIFCLAVMQGFMYIQSIRFYVNGELNNFNLSFAFNIGSGIITISILASSLQRKELLVTMNGVLQYFNGLKGKKFFHKTKHKCSK